MLMIKTKALSTSDGQIAEILSVNFNRFSFFQIFRKEDKRI